MRVTLVSRVAPEGRFASQPRFSGPLCRAWRTSALAHTPLNSEAPDNRARPGRLHRPHQRHHPRRRRAPLAVVRGLQAVGDAGASLYALASLAAQIDDLLPAAVADARDQDYTRTEIAALLAVSRDRAQRLAAPPPPNTEGATAD
jgi:hypothetical protein